MSFRQNCSILTANITVVTVPVHLDRSIQEQVRALLSEPVQIAVAETSPLGEKALNLTSLRDQLAIIIERSRVLFNDNSGKHPKERSWIDKVHEVLRIIDAGTQGFGFNYDIEFAADAASGPFIASKLLAPQKVEGLGANDVGAGVRLGFAQESQLHTLIIEPRTLKFGLEKAYAKLNLHHDESVDFPDTSALKASFEEGYEHFLSLVQSLLELQ